MDLIKFKSEHYKDNPNLQENFFNKFFCGKFALCPCYTAIITLEDFTYTEYNDIEKTGIESVENSKLSWLLDEDGNIVVNPETAENVIDIIVKGKIVLKDGRELECNCLNLTDFEDKIDLVATKKANSLSDFIADNNYISDIDIDIEDLKNFRQWLALSLLDLEQFDDNTEWDEEYEEDVNTMLEYYANDMLDDVIKAFMNLSSYSTNINMTANLSTNTSSCGCTSNIKLTGLTSLNSNLQTVDLSTVSISNCDPVLMYRRMIYNCMVETFRNIEFWRNKPSNFILEFAKYIRGIIDNNFPLVQSNYLTTFADCGCLNDDNASQVALMQVLENLYKSLMYIYNDEISGNKNFISTSIYNWASRLYEKMKW